jgi:hypothetical protein
LPIAIGAGILLLLGTLGLWYGRKKVATG